MAERKGWWDGMGGVGAIPLKMAQMMGKQQQQNRKQT